MKLVLNASIPKTCFSSARIAKRKECEPNRTPARSGDFLDDRIDVFDTWTASARCRFPSPQPAVEKVFLSFNNIILSSRLLRPKRQQAAAVQVIRPKSSFCFVGVLPIRYATCKTVRHRRRRRIEYTRKRHRDSLPCGLN